MRYSDDTDNNCFAIYCPKCFDKPLTESRALGGVPVDQCPSCRGLWLEGGNLQLLLKRLDGMTSEDLRLIKPEATDLACPHCGKNLAHGSLINPLLLAEKCPACDGIWLDAGELNLVEKLLGLSVSLPIETVLDEDTRLGRAALVDAEKAASPAEPSGSAEKDPDRTRERWTKALPDAAAFVVGLAAAWYGKWGTKDLVWSLWLSSLLVGYATILWGILWPKILGRTPSARYAGGPPNGQRKPMGAVTLVAFLTVPFFLAHLLLAKFLGIYFPLFPAGGSGLSMAVLWGALLGYLPFVLAVTVSERKAFSVPDPYDPVPDTVSDAQNPAIIMSSDGIGFTGVLAPYNHIFRFTFIGIFFGAVHFFYSGLNAFYVYASAYALYFFPWRLLLEDRALE